MTLKPAYATSEETEDPVADSKLVTEPGSSPSEIVRQGVDEHYDVDSETVKELLAARGGTVRRERIEAVDWSEHYESDEDLDSLYTGVLISDMVHNDEVERDYLRDGEVVTATSSDL